MGVGQQPDKETRKWIDFLLPADVSPWTTETIYRKISDEFVTTGDFNGQTILIVSPEGLSLHWRKRHLKTFLTSTGQAILNSLP
jgi:hypothetical protein